MVSKELREKLENMHYELAGRHGAVQICMWTKESLRGEGVCYKQKFYGIRSHRCCQMTPIVDRCDQRCLFCWRPWELSSSPKANSAKQNANSESAAEASSLAEQKASSKSAAKAHSLASEPEEPWDEPGELIKKCVAAQRKKLSGFGGSSNTDMAKFETAQEPMHFAISLAGEPTLYPHLAELIKDLHKQGKTSFLVTNGQHPEVLRQLKEKGALPTQLYISVDAPVKDVYEKLDNPYNKDGWDRLMKTLSLLPDLDCRKVLRFTLIKGWNMDLVKDWAKIIELANCPELMVEAKAYMYIGYSRRRMKKENMPFYEDIRDFSEKLAKELGWQVLDEQRRSRVVLLAREDFDGRVMKF